MTNARDHRFELNDRVVDSGMFSNGAGTVVGFNGISVVHVRWDKGGNIKPISCSFLTKEDDSLAGNAGHPNGIEFVVQDLNTPEMREVTRYRAHSIDTDNAPILIFFDANDVPIAFHHLAPNHSVIPLADG